MKVKCAIRAKINSRFQPESIETVKSLLMLASLLDLQYKRLPFLTSENARLHTRNRMNASTKSHYVSPHVSTFKLRNAVNQTFANLKQTTKNDEIASYLADKPSQDCEPLEWRKSNESKYPKIANIARRVLAVPATSVPSERIFSAVGLLINKLRNRLSSDIVDSIIFLIRTKFLALSPLKIPQRICE